MDKKWYAIFVKTGYEDSVRNEINNLNIGITAMVPKRKIRERKSGLWHDVLHILFPSYVLVNGIIDDTNYYDVKAITGIIKLLNGVITEQEINIIRRLTGSNDIIGYSNVNLDGKNIIVIDGPLTGLEGIITSLDKRKGRVKVKLNLMNEERLVDLSVNIVKETA